MKNNKTYKIVLAGLFAALCCIATYIHIPSFATNGYVNLGDCFVISSGVLLGPIWGAAAGGIGSMLTDIFLGYTVYAPATLIIKALMAFTAAIIYRTLITKRFFVSKHIVASVIVAICAEVIMVLGYGLYEAYVLHLGYAAVASITGNAIQAVAGIVGSVSIITLIEKTKIIH